MAPRDVPFTSILKGWDALIVATFTGTVFTVADAAIMTPPIIPPFCVVRTRIAAEPYDAESYVAPVMVRASAVVVAMFAVINRSEL